MFIISFALLYAPYGESLVGVSPILVTFLLFVVSFQHSKFVFLLCEDVFPVS